MTNKHLYVVLAGIFLFSAAPAFSKDFKTATTGAEFLSVCTRPDVDATNFCEGFVQAVFDTGYRPGASLCIPADTTRKKLLRTVVQDLKTKPEFIPHNAGVIIFAIMDELYPCS